MVEQAAIFGDSPTLEHRMRAAAEEVRGAFINYFHRAMKVRNWLPWDDLPLAEMRERGSKLSEDTVSLIQAFLGIEHYVGDYVKDWLALLHTWREQRNLHLTWGMEELRHAETWELVLLESGRRTKEQLDRYRDAVLQRVWRLRDDHPGLDNPLGTICYALLQERLTHFTYEGLRRRIRHEYGLPEEPTDLERERGQEIGASGAVKTVADDELEHHGIFLNVVQIYLRHFPHETLEMLQRTFSNFRPPAYSLIPDHARFSELLERTKVYNPLQYIKEIQNPVLAALGFDHKEALDRAATEVKQLPTDITPDQITIGRDGAIGVVRREA